MPVPFSFGAATTAIPLSQLDSNFNTPITLGNTAIQLGNTVTTLNNMTFANVTISSGNVTITNVTVTTANATTVNTTTLIATTANVTTGNVTNLISGNVTLTGGSITGTPISGSTGSFTTLTTSSTVTLNGGTANGVAFLDGSKVLTTGSALTFDGTNLGLGTASPVSIATYGIFTPNGTSGSAIYLQQGGATKARLITTANELTLGTTVATNPIVFELNNTEQMRLTSTGLGIGTSSPAQKLEIAATSPRMRMTDTDGGYAQIEADNGNLFLVSDNGNAVANSTLKLGVDGSTMATLDSSGNLGLGVTPSERLDVQTTAGRFQVQAYGAASVMLNSNGALAYKAATVGHQFFNDSTQAMTLDASGNLLVGKTSASTSTLGWSLYPTGLGDVVFTLTGTNEIFIWNNTATSGTARIDFRTGNVSKGKIQWDNSNTSYLTTSDYRLKENITPMTGALAKVAALNPVTYTWKTDGSDGQGFIAHELQAVCPDAVSGEKDAVNEDGSIKPQGIDTSFLVATLAAAIKELKAEFDAYKATHP